MLPVLLLFLIRGITCLRTAQLRGNLLFESEQQLPVTVNPHYIQFNRQFDLTHINNAINLLDNYTISYNDYCKELVADRKRINDMFQIMGNFYDARDACRERGGFLPEIRTEEDATKLIGIMKVVNLWEVPAGLTLVNNNTGMIYSRTGQNNAFLRYEPCKGCQIHSKLNEGLIEAHLRPNALRTIVYAISEQDDRLYITVATTCKGGERCKRNTILCTSGSDGGSGLVNAVVTQSCLRDSTFIKQTNSYLRAEFNSFVHPTENRNQNSRRRRSAVENALRQQYRG